MISTKRGAGGTAETGLAPGEIERIQVSHGVVLFEQRRSVKQPRQRFSVRCRGRQLAEITAENRFFTREELDQAIGSALEGSY